jgi:hypothetical protein
MSVLFIQFFLKFRFQTNFIENKTLNLHLKNITKFKIQITFVTKSKNKNKVFDRCALSNK